MRRPKKSSITAKNEKQQRETNPNQVGVAYSHSLRGADNSDFVQLAVSDVRDESDVIVAIFDEFRGVLREPVQREEIFY